MAPPHGNEDDGITAELAVDDEPVGMEKALDELWNVCNVLGITYESKMDEFGSVVSTERVVETVKFLEISRNNNFTMLKELAQKMSECWRTYNTNMSRMEHFSWILQILNAKNAEEIKDWNMLSTKAVKNVKAELTKLTNDWNTKMKMKYKAELSKLKKLLTETHQNSIDFGYDINEQVSPKNYKDEKSLIKNIIKAVKETSRERKMLVLRVEMARRAVNRKLSLEHIQDLLKLAKEEVMKLKNEEDEPILYDGENVEYVLNSFQALAVQHKIESTQEKTALSKTRSGRVM